MPATDAMIARLEAELEERNAFIEGLVAAAEDDRPRPDQLQEMEMIASARTRIASSAEQLDPLRETSRLSIESRRRVTEIDAELQGQRRRNRWVRGRVPLRRRLHRRPVLRPARRPRRRRSGSRCSTGSPPTRRPPTTRGCCPRRSSARSSTSSRSPARLRRRSARPTSARGAWSLRPGHPAHPGRQAGR